VLRSGLAAGERVVVDGIVRVGQGTLVKPEQPKPTQAEVGLPKPEQSKPAQAAVKP
jgi:hypothetical protein